MRFLATTNMFMANQASILRLVDYNNNTVLSLDQNGLSIPSYQPLISSTNKIDASLINNLSSAISNAYIPNNSTYTLPNTHPGQIAYGVTNTNVFGFVRFILLKKVIIHHLLIPLYHLHLLQFFSFFQELPPLMQASMESFTSTH
jgi:hypothetical protein